MNLDLVPSPAFTPRPGAPIIFGGLSAAAPVGPSAGTVSAASRQAVVNLTEMETDEATQSPRLPTPVGRAQMLSPLPPTPGKHINLSEELETTDSETQSEHPPLMRKQIRRSRSPQRAGDADTSMTVDLQAAPPSEEIRRHGSGTIKKSLQFAGGSLSVGCQPIGQAASAGVSHRGPTPLLETHVSAPLVIRLPTPSMRRGGGGATSKIMEATLEMVEPDFPPNAAELDAPNEPLSPTPEVAVSPSRPALSGGLS